MYRFPYSKVMYMYLENHMYRLVKEGERNTEKTEIVNQNSLYGLGKYLYHDHYNYVNVILWLWFVYLPYFIKLSLIGYIGSVIAMLHVCY